MLAIFAQRLIEPLVSRRNLYSCRQDVKEAAYKGLVRHGPVLEYGSSVWDPHGVELESEQKRADRFVTGTTTKLRV